MGHPASWNLQIRSICGALGTALDTILSDMPTKVPYTPPQFGLKAFHCPICGAYAAQSWLSVFQHIPQGNPFEKESQRCQLSRCTHCEKLCLWWDKNLVFPIESSAPP